MPNVHDRTVSSSDGSPHHIDTLASATRRFADVIDTADMTRAVPSCPGWSVEDLVRHIGGVHEWAAAAIGAERGSPIPGGDDAPRDRLAEWYRERAGVLIETLTLTGDSAPAWVFAPTAGAGRSSFWIRRQIHETVMHTWDALAAQGIFEPLEPTLAWDGVEEVRDIFYPRQIALHRIAPLPRALHLQADDLDRPAVTIGSGDPITVRLSASDTLLALWHRTSPVAVDGPAATLFAAALTP